MQNIRPTVELTRRRESKHPSPHQVSYETRSRRSRPTICWAARSVGDTQLIILVDPSDIPTVGTGYDNLTWICQSYTTKFVPIRLNASSKKTLAVRFLPTSHALVQFSHRMSFE